MNVIWCTGSLCAHSAGSSNGVAVFLTLDKAPIAGEPVTFKVKVINKQNIAKNMKVHFNAQAKEYNHSPLDTFWETHGIIQLAPMEGTSTSIYTVRYLLYLQNYCGVNSSFFFPLCLSSHNFLPADPPSPVWGCGGRQPDQPCSSPWGHVQSGAGVGLRGVQHHKPWAQHTGTAEILNVSHQDFQWQSHLWET